MSWDSLKERAKVKKSMEFVTGCDSVRKSMGFVLDCDWVRKSTAFVMGCDWVRMLMERRKVVTWSVA